MVRWLGAAAKAAATGRSRLKAIKAYLRGKDSTRLRRLTRECFENEVEPRLSPEAVDRLRWHQSAGHLVILLSGTPGTETDWTSGGGFADTIFDNLIASGAMPPSGGRKARCSPPGSIAS